MRESIANSYVFSIVLTIVAVASALIVVSMNYSKVFKMKNRIIEIIEKHGEYNNGDVRDEIEAFLSSAGYPPYPSTTISCPRGRGDETAASEGFTDTDIGVRNINTLRNYKYCVYQFKTAKGSYYQVSVFMTFDFPIIGDFLKLELPMYGDTKIIYDY